MHELNSDTVLVHSLDRMMMMMMMMDTYSLPREEKKRRSRNET